MSMEGFFNSRSVRRKTEFNGKKLQINERVEVRSFEDGFLGSWHPGMVIDCGKLKRHVRYENVLADDGLNYIVEVVNVSNVLDGEFGFPSKRGTIRPMPPLVVFKKSDLKFGLCVDVSYQEAWWEGVIFDHCDGMEERSVFFPDLGDEMKVEIHQMRITQDWDEVTGKWERRGYWVFLELIEECERGSYLPVSVKQIWYDVRQKKEFDAIGEWTLNVRKDLWTRMIVEVVNDYMALTIKEVNSALKLSEMEPVGLKANVDSNVTLSEKECFEQKEPVTPVENDLPKFQIEISRNVAGEESNAISFMKKKHRSSTYSTSHGWKRQKFSAEYCPDVVKQYILASDHKDRGTMKKLKVNVWKHLAFLGWEIDLSETLYGKRYRYKLPNVQTEKKEYYSLIELCKVIQMESTGNSSPSKTDLSKTHPIDDCHVPPVPLNQSEKIQNQDVSPLVVQPHSVAVADEPKYWPEAIVEYHKRALESKWAGKRKYILKVKEHLLAEGWILIDPPPNNRRKGIKYISPQKRSFNSLNSVCKFYTEEIIPKLSISSGMQPLNTSAINEEIVDRVWSVAANRSSANRKRKRLRNSNDRLLRSSKRVRKVSAACLSHQKPLNVLSWLIDSNVVLPRSKVYYRAKRGHRVMSTGKLTHEGIKCNCCMGIYSLVSFEYHAIGSSTPRPSASIFLENGKSLLDCQMQIMQEQKSKEAIVKPRSILCLGENDYICSVCHYGGDLILCDQCPSSFHQSCLGLEDVPDGDWFCPSCRCGICGQTRFNGGGEDEPFLTCIQCEHKYHVECLKNRDTSASLSYKESRFCGKDCEKLYEDLQSLLGKPVSVGEDNLTWRLVKCNDSQSSDLDSSNNELLAESYSKLNVAISMMHECFEPLKESSSSGDLMEDVIFSRWSALNRMNFRGFYTVLLERNEDMVSVATVRVFGDKVAEIPLVGTRLQYRRHGMCRILMDELEKKLLQLGVERLVLPAVPSVLDTWTGAFGFSKMTNFERSQFLDYTFLDFPGTIMCQKLLTKIPSPSSVLSLELQQKQVANSGSSSDKSPISEVYQAGEIEKREMMDPQMLDALEGDNDNLGSAIIDCVAMGDQPNPEDQQHCQKVISPQDTFVKWNGFCYHRRRKVEGERV